MSAPAWADDVRAQYDARGIGGRIEASGRIGVVVVDLIRGFTDPACPPGSLLDDVVSATTALVEAARRTGAFVAFTTIAFERDEIDRLVWLKKMPALRVLVEGSSWVDLDDRFVRADGEPLIAKKAASAFSGTDLALFLRQAGVESVIVCGATTSGCIRATVIDACSLGWPTFVPREAVGDRAPGPHEANLVDIDAKYADVISVDDALALLDRAGAA